MKKNILAILLFVILIPAWAQTETVPSSCTAPDSIVNLYKDDADRLAIRRVYRNYSPYMDSIQIPKFWRENSLRALLAVYNADSLSASDTIFSLLNIHTLTNIEVERLTIRSDSNLMWAKQLCDWGTPTGNYSVDSFVTQNHLQYERCYYNIFFPSMYVDFITDSNYNMNALGKAFSSISGVYYYGQQYYPFDGPDITDSVYINFTELVFAYKWGDCFNGCTKKRSWKFHVLPDCSVEYLGSYGDVLPAGVSARPPLSERLTIYPNPFLDYITVEGLTGKFHYQVTDVTGKIQAEADAEHTIVLRTDLPAGMYFISIQTDEGVLTRKLVKR